MHTTTEERRDNSSCAVRLVLAHWCLKEALMEERFLNIITIRCVVSFTASCWYLEWTTGAHHRTFWTEIWQSHSDVLPPSEKLTFRWLVPLPSFLKRIYLIHWSYINLVHLVHPFPKVGNPSIKREMLWRDKCFTRFSWMTEDCWRWSFYSQMSFRLF